MNNQSQTTTTTTTTTTMGENFTDFTTATTEAPMMSGFDDDWAANNSTMASGTAKDSSSSTSDDNTVTSMVGCAMFLLFVMYYGCCQRRRPVSTDTGDRIRRIARERWRREQLEQERNTQKPEKRQELLRLCLRNKKVISKDAEGNLQLGPLHKASVPAPAPVVCSPCTPAAGVAATVALVPTTPPTAPTTPTTPTTPTPTPDHGTVDDDDEEEHACVICLEPFEVDDIVSWSRYSKTCHHVFHTDCIEPWLLERRQDDCPSCRSKLVQFNYDDPDSPVKENLEKLLSSTSEDNAEQDHVQDFHLEDDDDDDEGEEEGDSIFVIVHGMISRAARQATSSYALVGTKDSMEEDDYDSEREEVEGEEDFSDIEEGGKKPSAVDLANPAPMRRVMSYEAIAHDSPQHNRKRRSLRGSIRDMFFPRKLFSEEEELEAKERAMQQQRYDQQEEHRPVPLRRVVSEGLSPNAPSLPDVSDRTAAAVSNMIPSSPSQTLQRRASTSSFLQMRRSESYQQQYDHSEASSCMSDEEDDLEWRFGAISPSPLSPASSRLAGTGEQQRPTISIPDGACPLPSANNDDDGDEDEEKAAV